MFLNCTVSVCENLYDPNEFFLEDVAKWILKPFGEHKLIVLDLELVVDLFLDIADRIV